MKVNDAAVNCCAECRNTGKISSHHMRKNSLCNMPHESRKIQKDGIYILYDRTIPTNLCAVRSAARRAK